MGKSVSDWRPTPCMQLPKPNKFYLSNIIYVYAYIRTHIYIHTYTLYTHIYTFYIYIHIHIHVYIYITSRKKFKFSKRFWGPKTVPRLIKNSHKGSWVVILGVQYEWQPLGDSQSLGISPQRKPLGDWRNSWRSPDSFGHQNQSLTRWKWDYWKLSRIKKSSSESSNRSIVNGSLESQHCRSASWAWVKHWKAAGALTT